MTDNKLYVLVLCIIVYVALTALFSVLIAIVTKQSLKLVRLGVEDEKIKTEYLKNRQKKRSKFMGIIDTVIPIVCCVIMLVFFVSSFLISCTENNVVGDIPSLKVVSSTSMSKKEEKNGYLTDNNLHDQLQMYDVIVTHKLPDQFELKQYDIVVYEVDGILLVHRIVNIEEPNEKHPNERWFQLQGDAVPNPDKFPVKYEQMKSIYRGERIPFVGTFIFFLQSTAGMLCVLLMVFASIVTPFIEKKFQKEYNLRLQAMGVLDKDLNYIEPVAEKPVAAQTEPQPPAQQEQAATQTPATTEQPAELVVEMPALIDVPEQEAELSQEQQEQESVVYAVAENSVPEVSEPAATIAYVTNAVDAPLEEDTSSQPASIFSAFNKGKNLSFRQKLQALSDEMKQRYKSICHYALKYENVRFSESKRCFTLTIKRLPLVRFFVKGKTVVVCLALNPENFDAKTFGFTASAKGKLREDYPMQIKLTSNLRAKRTCLLLEEAFKPYIKTGALKLDKLRSTEVSDYDLCLKNVTVHIEDVVSEREMIEERRKISFSERIRKATQEVKLRYKQVVLALVKCEKIKSRISFAHQTIKLGNTPIAKLTVRGKTLSLFLSVSPNDYSHKKGLFTDVSLVKAHGDYPTLIKLTSERRLKNALEIINEKYNSLIESGKLKQKDLSSVADFGFLADLGIKLGFKERLNLASEEVKTRYQEIISVLEGAGVTLRESTNYVTAKIKSKKIAKIALRGKTLRVYLALNPDNYLGTKYKFTNVSHVKAHQGYPMLIKVTSKRKQKYLKELISSLIK